MNGHCFTVNVLHFPLFLFICSAFPLSSAQVLLRLRFLFPHLHSLLRLEFRLVFLLDAVPNESPPHI